MSRGNFFWSRGKKIFSSFLWGKNTLNLLYLRPCGAEAVVVSESPIHLACRVFVSWWWWGGRDCFLVVVVVVGQMFFNFSKRGNLGPTYVIVAKEKVTNSSI